MKYFSHIIQMGSQRQIQLIFGAKFSVKIILILCTKNWVAISEYSLKFYWSILYWSYVALVVRSMLSTVSTSIPTSYVPLMLRKKVAVLLYKCNVGLYNLIWSTTINPMFKVGIPDNKCTCLRLNVRRSLKKKTMANAKIWEMPP